MLIYKLYRPVKKAPALEERLQNDFKTSLCLSFYTPQHGTVISRVWDKARDIFFFFSDLISHSLRQAMLEKIPLGRFAEPQEIASVVHFLLSERSAMVNGACIPVDGGYLVNG